MLNELAEKIHTNAVAHGFYDDEKVNIPEKLMLIVTELGEAMEAYRNEHYADLEEAINERVNIYLNKSVADTTIESWNLTFEDFVKNTYEDELADTIIRILDLCAYMKIDIDKHIMLKNKYNESRPYKHGKIC